MLKYVEEKRQESRNNILWCRINYSTALSRPSYLEKNITMTYGPNVWEVKRTQLFVHTENISKLKTVAPSQLRFHAFLPILTAYVKLKVKEGRKRVMNEKTKKQKIEVLSNKVKSWFLKNKAPEQLDTSGILV